MRPVLRDGGGAQEHFGLPHERSVDGDRRLGGHPRDPDVCQRVHQRRLERGIARDGEGKRSQWEDIWMPQEDDYVAAQKPEQRADRVVSGEEPFPL